MTQKLNNDQLRQLYFESSTPSKSFRKHKDHIKTSGSKQFFDTNINYERFSEKEINRFENFFNTHVYPASQNYIFKEPKIISTSKATSSRLAIQAVPEPLMTPALLEDKTPSFTDPYHEPDLQFQSEKEEASVEVEMPQFEKGVYKQIKIDDEAENEVQEDNDDLIYLETLMGSGVNGFLAPSPDSLSDIFAEIVDNEKESISNYESSVFDANIEMLFGKDSEVVVELPPVPFTQELTLITPKIVDESKTQSVINSEDAEIPVEVSKEFVETTSPEIIAAHIEDFVPEKKKRKKKKEKSKLGIFDTILILIILVILAVLAFHVRDSLPFDLPF